MDDCGQSERSLDGWVALTTMPTASGVSIKGQQQLIGSVTAPNKLLSIAITNYPVPPIRRAGYFYLYMFKNAAPFQTFVIQSGILDAPGQWLIIPVPLFDATYLYRVDVAWNSTGFNWTVNIV